MEVSVENSMAKYIMKPAAYLIGIIDAICFSNGKIEVKYIFSDTFKILWLERQLVSHNGVKTILISHRNSYTL